MNRLVVILFLACVTLGGLNLSQPPTQASPSVRYVPPPQSRYFTFGYDLPLADSLWLRVLPRMDVCEQKEPTANSQTTSAPPAGGDPLDDILLSIRTPSRCHKGWAYQMLDRITDLDPRFRAPFVSGATSLSVLVDDRDGATLMFEKGLRYFPDDWSLAFRAAYHYLYELGDVRRAAALLIQAGRHGAPAWVYALAARLYTRDGQAEFAYQILSDFLATSPQGYGIERVYDQVQKLEKLLKKSAK